MKFTPNKRTKETCEFMIAYSFKGRNNLRFDKECYKLNRTIIKDYIQSLREIRKKERMYPSLF